MKNLLVWLFYMTYITLGLHKCAQWWHVHAINLQYQVALIFSKALL